jgi:hypothetical protein
MFRRVFFGPVENPENRGLIDLGLREKAVMVAMIVPMVWIGVYPETFLRRLHPPVLDLLHVMEAKAGDLAGPSAERARARLFAALDASEARSEWSERRNAASEARSERGAR